MTDKYIRYSKTRIIDNDTEEYYPLFEKRGVKSIIHPAMGGLKYPTESEVQEFTIQKEEWKIGDRLWKMAEKYYNGRSHYWWVIAHFNQKPTEQHFEIGDIVYIPLPLENVLRSYGL